MALRDLENLVHAALNCGLIGPQQRQTLMRGLPMGFVYSLPTVSRPIDQLRFDLMELERTPRLIGLDRPPLAVWLSNAADMTAAEGKAEAARLFAGEADRLSPGGVQAKTEAALRRAGAGAEGAAASGASSAPHTPHAARQHRLSPERTHVLALDSAGADGWKTVDPPIDPINTYAVDLPRGDWPRRDPPPTGCWRQVRDRIDAQLEAIIPQIRPGDGLAVFLRDLPPAMAMLLGSRLRGGLPQAETALFEQVRVRGRNRWQAWGPGWPTEPSEAEHPVLRATPHGINARAADLAVLVEVSGRLHTDAVERALARGIGGARLTLSHRKPHPAALTDPEAIERAVADIADALAAHVAPERAVRRLHIFYEGPAALAVRLADEVMTPRRAVTVYVEQADGFVPAVEISPGGVATLALEPAVGPGGDGIYDAFIAYASPDEAVARALYGALTTDLKLNVFMDRMSLSPGDAWTSEIPAAQARARSTIALISAHSGAAWYQSEEVIDAIRHTRGSAGEYKVIPVLLDGMKPDKLLYGLGKLTPVQVRDGLQPDDAARHITEALRPVFERMAPSAKTQGTP